MNILTINGSPSGDASITLQTMLYLQQLFPDHIYAQLNASQSIRALEKDFSAAEEVLKEADLIVFCYPVYTFLVPSQLHRFLELIEEHEMDLSGKYAVQISTSKHFYDVTAHRFIKERCSDFGMKYIDGLSADMEDLLSKKGQQEAEAFFAHVLWCTEHDYYEKLPEKKAETFIADQVTVPEKETEKKSGHQIVIVTDLSDDQPYLSDMIDRFRSISAYPCRIVNLHDFPFAGGCLGCFHCASDGVCIYKDGFDTFLREQIQNADATVYAFTIKDHSMGHRFRLYDDRQFCNGHRTVTMGKPVGYLIDGKLSAEENLQILMKARAQVGGNYLAGIVCNEADGNERIDQLADNLAYALEHDYNQPADFYGVGGMKIFRDLIYQMQGMMKEDHRFYKEHGFYDFPQKRKGMILGMYLVGSMMNNPKLKNKMNMTDGMLMPYRQIIKKAGKKKK